MCIAKVVGLDNTKRGSFIVVVDKVDQMWLCSCNFIRSSSVKVKLTAVLPQSWKCPVKSPNCTELSGTCDICASSASDFSQITVLYILAGRY